MWKIKGNISGCSEITLSHGRGPLGREFETSQGGNNSDKGWGARPAHPQVLHGPLTCPENNGRGQGSCPAAERL